MVTTNAEKVQWFKQNGNWKSTFFPPGGFWHKLRCQQAELQIVFEQHFDEYFAGHKRVAVNKIISHFPVWYDYILLPALSKKEARHCYRGVFEPIEDALQLAKKVRQRLRDMKKRKELEDLSKKGKRQQPRTRSGKKKDLPIAVPVALPIKKRKTNGKAQARKKAKVAKQATPKQANIGINRKEPPKNKENRPSDLIVLLHKAMQNTGAWSSHPLLCDDDFVSVVTALQCLQSTVATQQAQMDRLNEEATTLRSENDALEDQIKFLEEQSPSRLDEDDMDMMTNEGTLDWSDLLPGLYKSESQNWLRLME